MTKNNKYIKLSAFLLVPVVLVALIFFFPQSAAAAQIARPNQDIQVNGWTPEPLFEEINEETRNDNDFISSEDNSNTVAEVGLTALEDPGINTGHVLRYTYRKSAVDGHVINITVRLMEGATEIASWTHNGITENWVQEDQTLTEEQAGNITDYTNLSVQFERGGDTGGPGVDRRSAEVSWTELEVPSAPVLTQQDFRVFENTASTTPGAAIADENATATDIAQNEVIRIRMNVEVTEADLPATSTSFRLQYAQKTESSCLAVPSGNFSEVGATSSDEIWRGFENSGPGDGDELSDLLLTNSNVAGTYEEHNPSAVNPSSIPIGSFGEWDWVVQNNGALNNTVYCFRMVREDSSEIEYNGMAEVQVIRGLTQLKYRWRADDGGE